MAFYFEDVLRVRDWRVSDAGVMMLVCDTRAFRGLVFLGFGVWVFCLVLGPRGLGFGIEVLGLRFRASMEDSKAEGIEGKGVKSIEVV